MPRPWELRSSPSWCRVLMPLIGLPTSLQHGLARRRCTRQQECRHLHVVSPDWLWSCLERWDKVEEHLFPLTDDDAWAHRENSPAASPDRQTMLPAALFHRHLSTPRSSLAWKFGSMTPTLASSSEQAHKVLCQCLPASYRSTSELFSHISSRCLVKSCPVLEMESSLDLLEESDTPVRPSRCRFTLSVRRTWASEGSHLTCPALALGLGPFLEKDVYFAELHIQKHIILQK
jgi:hypothetical protein